MPDSSSFADLLRSRTLGEVLADILRGRILGGALAPGAPLDEGWLAAAYGIPRQPVREALRTLTRDGLLDITEQGCHVAAPDPGETAFARDLLALVERTADIRGVESDAGALARAMAGDPAAWPEEPVARLCLAVQLPLLRKLALARPIIDAGAVHR